MISSTSQVAASAFGGWAKPADEQQVGAALRFGLLVEPVEGIRGYRAHVRFRHQRGDIVRFLLRGIQHDVRLPPDLAFEAFQAARLFPQVAAAGHFRLAVEAAEMQVMAVVGHAHLRREGAQRLQVRQGHMRAGQEHRVQLGSAFAQVIGEAPKALFAVDDLHAALLQRRPVVRIEPEVVGPELDQPAGSPAAHR